MKKKLVFFLFICYTGIHAQDIEYARNVINTLCSPAYQGRGYVKNGDGKAAIFIYDELKKLPGMQVQYQPFAFPVNTFPKKVAMAIDGVALKPGTDFLADPACPSIRGAFEVLLITGETLASETEFSAFAKGSYSKTLIIVDTLGTLDNEAKARLELVKNNSIKAAGIVTLAKGHIIWSVATNQQSFAQLEVLENKFPRNAKKITLNIQAQLIEKHVTNNVLGYIPGTKYKDSIIVLTAHYDHLGRMGKKTYFPGANDNASGTAIMLDIARHYAQQPPEHPVLFIAFAAEEAGLIGSQYYTTYPVYPLHKMKFLINLDLIGTGEKGLMAVNGQVFTPQYDALVKINEEHHYLSTIQSRGKAANSDHYWFTEKGVKSFFFYLMGDYPHYHDPGDRPEILPLTEYEDTFRLITDFINYLQDH